MSKYQSHRNGLILVAAVVVLACLGLTNCLMPYGLPTKEQMDLAQKHGLKVIYSVKDWYAGARLRLSCREHRRSSASWGKTGRSKQTARRSSSCCPDWQRCEAFW